MSLLVAGHTGLAGCWTPAGLVRSVVRWAVWASLSILALGGLPTISVVAAESAAIPFVYDVSAATVLASN